MTKKKSEEIEPGLESVAAVEESGMDSAGGVEEVAARTQPSTAAVSVGAPAESFIVEFKGEDGAMYRRIHKKVGGGWRDYCERIG